VKFRDGCSERLFRKIVNEALRERSGARLVAAYRSWWGTDGAGIFTRLQLADDIDALVAAAVEHDRATRALGTRAPRKDARRKKQ
jgi:hypothetical protein